MKWRKKFLLTLVEKKRVTRKELVDHLGVAVSTLSYMIDEMKRMGFLTSMNVAHGRGRPYEILELKKDAWFGISMKVGRESVRLMLFDARMTPIEEKEVKITKECRNTEGYRRIIESLLKPFEDHEKLVCVGISTSGIVENGKILHSPIMNVKDLDLHSIVYSLFPNSHVSILNDVEALANYEKHEFDGNRLLVINYGTGIGAAFLENGKRKFFEFGHVIVDPDGEKCYCGQRGCLETVASEYAVLKKFMNEDFSIMDFVEYEEERYRIRLDELRRLSRNNPKKVRRFFTDSLKILSKELSNLVIILNPKRVSFYGEGINRWMVEDMKTRIGTMLSKYRLSDVEFVCRENIPYSWEVGVLLDSLEKYLDTL